MTKTLVATSLLLFTGCSFGSATPASAVRNATLDADQHTFAREDVSLVGKTNLFVFWKVQNGQVNPTDVAAVVSLSEKIQSDEDRQFIDLNTVSVLRNKYLATIDFQNVLTELTTLEGDATNPLSATDVTNCTAQDCKALKTDLDALLGPAQTGLTALNTANPADKTADDQINTLTADENTAQAKLTAEQAKPTPDPAVVSALQTEISSDDTQIQSLHKTAPQGQLTWRQYHAKATAFETTIQGTSDIETVIAAATIADWLQWLAAYNDSQIVIKQCSDDITEIIGGTLSDGTVTPGHVMPVIGAVNPELYIHFSSDDSITMKLDNWFPPVGWESPDGSQSGNPPIFSTADGSIRDVSYEPLGGVFQFTVVTRWAEYGFKIARTHYNAADGLQHFQGEINLYSDDASQPMRGTAVLDQQ